MAARLPRRFRLLIVALSSNLLVPLSLRVVMLRFAGLKVGEGVDIPSGLEVADGTDVVIGDGVHFNRGVLIGAASPVVLEKNCGVAARVMILTSTHELGPSEKRYADWTPAPITIREGAWLGAGAIVLAGVEVAKGCIVAAGAVVTKSTEPDGLYAGVPARRIRDLPLTID